MINDNNSTRLSLFVTRKNMSKVRNGISISFELANAHETEVCIMPLDLLFIIV